MKIYLSLLALAVSFNVYSAELLCDISVNLDILSQTTVTTELNEKTSIDSVGSVTAYVTEKENNHYIVEAFLADHEIRIYGEGTLRDKSDKVVASAWSRDSIIDIQCTLNN